MPPYLTPREVADACRMTRKRAQSMLRRAGILERIGERWCVGESQLRERLPEVYDRVYSVVTLRPRESPSGPLSAQAGQPARGS